MPKQTNALSYIMNALDIKGTALAKAMFVDRTLVSKWKNGARAFTPTPKQLELAITYILDANKNSQNNTLERLFSNIYHDYDTNNKSHTHQYLTTWLKGNKGGYDLLETKLADHHLYLSSYKVYLGKQGRRDASNHFFSNLAVSKKAKQIYLSDMQNFSWIEDDQSALVGILSQYFAAEHQITIIINMREEFSHIEKLIPLLIPYFFTRSLKIYYYMPQINEPLPSLYCFKDEAIFYNYQSKDNYSAIYHDPATVSMYQEIIQSRIEHSQPMLDVLEYTPETIASLNNVLDTRGYNKDEAYLITPLPVFTTMRPKTLLQVMTDNGLPENIVAQAGAMHKQIQEIFLADVSKYFCRQIYDLDLINRISDMDETTYMELSTLSGMEIKVAKKHFKAHLKYLISLMDEYPLFEVALIPFRLIKQLDTTSIWVKQNSFLYTYPFALSKLYVLSTDTTTIQNFYNLSQDMWNSLPIANRSKEWVRNQLMKIIEFP